MKHRLLTFLSLLPILCFAQVQAEGNYIRVSTYLNAAGTDSITDITYYDELGRESEQISVGGSPTGTDLATLTEYDKFGRIEKKWLPSTTPFSNGKFLHTADIKEAAQTLYEDNCPFSKNRYEHSPTNRLVEVLQEGESWHHKSKTIKYDYAINQQNNDVLNAVRFTVDKECWNDLVPIVKNAGCYGNGSLRITVTTDEDGRRTYSFRDFEDRVLLNRQLLENGNFCDTYYIYDARGNLLAVLPPLASDLMQEKGTELDLTLELGELAYVYFYDDRGRCICKKLPGQEPYLYVYDTTDIPVLYQTPWLREKGLWGFQITDSWGRTCLEGTCKNSLDFDFQRQKTLGAVNARKRDGGNFFGYDITGIELKSPTITKVNFYDDYRYLTEKNYPVNLAMAFSASNYSDEICDTPKGLRTGSITTILSGEKGETSTIDAGNAIFHTWYYDYKNRNVFLYKSNLLGGYATEQRVYDYVGNLIKRQSLYKTEDVQDIEEIYTYSYDKRGRLIDETHQLNGKTVRELAHNIYDDTGRLKAIRRNNSADFSTTYNYNVRSWETEITSPHFKELLFYELPEDKDAKACYNGNISVMRWGFEGESKVSQMRSYRFLYDKLDRLTQADYNDVWGQKDQYSTWYSYDKQGNLLALERYNTEPTSGVAQLIDDATFQYDGNKLLGYTDCGFESSTADITLPNNYEGGNKQFAYDTSGNIIKNRNKGITQIDYNLINLPERITFDDGKEIIYTYDADGNKLRVQYPWLNYSILYDDRYQFRQDGTGKHHLSEIDLEEVFIRGVASNNPVYYYKFKDHLGSVRIVMGTDGSISGGNNYYPYGGDFATSRKNLWGYRFCDRKLDRVNSLDLYDSQARFLDPELGRFYSQDSMAEDDYSVSPYLYCLANPINTLDDDGNSAWSKIAKVGFRVGRTVARNGFSALAKSATYAESAADITDNTRTVFDSNASTGDRFLAGVSLASEFLPVSVGDIKDGKKLIEQIAKKAHGNSRLSTRAQHAYDVFDNATGKVVKTGVSGGKIRKDGKSYRAEKQVRKWNKEENTDKYESVITKKVPTGKGAREEVLKYEKKRATELRKKGHLVNSNKHQKP